MEKGVVGFNIAVKFELGDLSGMPVECVEALFAGIAKVIAVKNEVEESLREKLEQAKAAPEPPAVGEPDNG